MIESEQVTKINKESTGQQSWLKPNELGGRLRVAKFNFNSTDDLKAGESLADPTDILLTVLPKGAQLVGIEGYNGAFGAGVVADFGISGRDGSGTYDCAGTADDTDFLEAGVSVAAAGTYVAGKDTPGFLYNTEKEVYITLQLRGAVPAAGIDIDGVIYYVDNT